MYTIHIYHTTMKLITFGIILLFLKLSNCNEIKLRLLEDGNVYASHVIEEIYQEDDSINSTDIPNTTEYPETCDSMEYIGYNGSCQNCLLHDENCYGDIQCCSTPHMGCYKVNPGKVTLCKCHYGYYWNSTGGYCYVPPMPPFIVIMMYTALISVGIIAISAIIVLICSFCSQYFRNSRPGEQRPQFRVRQRRRRNNNHNNSHDIRYERRLSSLIPYMPSQPRPDKPPSYDEVYTISPNLQRNESIRSLPPAYTPPETTTTTVNIVTTNNPNNNTDTQPQQSIAELQVEITQRTTPYQSQTGISNPAYSSEI